MINTIYRLRNKYNDKSYIGQTWRSLDKRWNHGHGYRECKLIARAIKKYGKDNFYYEILVYCLDQDTANYWEKFFIEKYDSINNGYNLCIGGTYSGMRGLKHSEESKKKISESKIGCNGNKGSFKDGNVPWHAGQNNVYSEDTKKKMSEARLGKSPSNKISSELEAKIIEMYILGDTYNDIITLCNIKRHTFYRVLKRNNIVCRRFVK